MCIKFHKQSVVLKILSNDRITRLLFKYVNFGIICEQYDIQQGKAQAVRAVELAGIVLYNYNIVKKDMAIRMLCILQHLHPVYNRNDNTLYLRGLCKICDKIINDVQQSVST